MKHSVSPIRLACVAAALLTVSACAGTPPPGQEQAKGDCVVTGSNLGNHHCSSAELGKSATSSGVVMGGAPATMSSSGAGRQNSAGN